MSYNLSDNVNDDFKFSIKDTEYVMRYPLVEEIETLQELSKEVDGETVEQKEIREKKALDFMYQFVSGVKADSPKIDDILKTQNIKVMQNFNQMIKTEFSIGK